HLNVSVGFVSLILRNGITSCSFTTEQRLWVSIDWSKVPAGDDLSASIEVTSNAGKHAIKVPVFKPAGPSRDEVSGFVESHGYVSMEAEHFTKKESRGGAAWDVVKGLGRSGDSVTVFPPTVASQTELAGIRSSSPSMQYEIYLFHSGEARLDIDCLPTKAVAPSRGVSVAVSIDGQEPQIVDGKGGDVLTNLRRMTTKVNITEPGKHTLTVWMVDPAVVIDKLVLDFRPPVETYLGPLESYRR
ncbi:MAG: hypothetical protein WCS43_15435, partial [Verrucomicrobiota bacterium]